MTKCPRCFQDRVELCDNCRNFDTLRDQFAMAAVTGILADSTVRDSAEKFADRAYMIADAMMERRKK